MPLYKVSYKGFYIIEAETIDEAMDTDREDYEVQYETWENIDAEEVNDVEIY